MEHMGRLGEEEVVDEASVTCERLCADPGRRREEIVSSKLGQIAPSLSGVRGSGEVAVYLNDS